MTTTKILKSLLIAALLASATAQAADQTIVIAMEEGSKSPLSASAIPTVS